MDDMKDRQLDPILVRIELLKRRITGREIACAVGLHESTVSLALTGQRSSFDTRLAIAEHLGVPLAEIVRRDAPEQVEQSTTE